MKDQLRFPRDLLHFLYWIYFKPFTLRSTLVRIDPSLTSTAAIFKSRQGGSPGRRAVNFLILFYVFLVPGLSGLGLSFVLKAFGLNVNFLMLVLYLAVGTALSLSFSPAFCIVFLLPFSLAAAVVSATGFTLGVSIFLSFSLGLAYGLILKPARWGLISAAVYSLVLGLLAGAWTGLAIGAVFLAGYFRVPLYLIEALLSWLLSLRAARADAVRLWRWQPAAWDELIWFPLPGLDRHLRALSDQDPDAAEAVLALVKGSFRQKPPAELEDISQS